MYRIIKELQSVPHQAILINFVWVPFFLWSLTYGNNLVSYSIIFVQAIIWHLNDIGYFKAVCGGHMNNERISISPFWELHSSTFRHTWSLNFNGKIKRNNFAFAKFSYIQNIQDIVNKIGSIMYTISNRWNNKSKLTKTDHTENEHADIQCHSIVTSRDTDKISSIRVIEKGIEIEIEYGFMRDTVIKYSPSINHKSSSIKDFKDSSEKELAKIAEKQHLLKIENNL